MKRFQSLQGVTLIELIIASTILMAVLTAIMAVYTQFSSSKRYILLNNQLYNESSYLLENMAREIQNGTIDYQSYYRENIKNRTAKNWIHDSGEAPNPKGAEIAPNDDLYATTTVHGLNSYKNCNTAELSATDSGSDSYALAGNALAKRLDMVLNYRYQFIYPGKTNVAGGNDESGTPSEVHLNCTTDNYNAAVADPIKGQYNVNDDDTAYGSGPRAFDESPHDTTRNFARGSQMLWDWNTRAELEAGEALTPVLNNNPPIFLIKSDAEKLVYTRTALRFHNHAIELMRFLGVDTDTSPPDFIPDRWKCDTNFACGPAGSESYDGTYIWSQKESKKVLVAPDTVKGEDNGIGTITDSRLTWKNITPEDIEILSFDFILSPVKDPKRAFAEKERIQKPQITLILEAQIKKNAMKGVSGNPPKIRLQTTVTPRVWDLIEADN